MKIIINKFIPFHGYTAMTFYGIIFWRKECEYKMHTDVIYNRILNHEAIHKAQMKDFCKWLPIGGTIFYLVYLLEWIFRLIFVNGPTSDAYRNLSFEKEAKLNERNLNYLNTRLKFAQFKK